MKAIIYGIIYGTSISFALSTEIFSLYMMNKKWVKILKQNIFIAIFIIDIIFISLIPNLSKIFTPGSGSFWDFLIPYCAGFLSFLTIGILVGVLCIKKISQK